MMHYMSQLFIPSSPNSQNVPGNLSFTASTVHVAHLAEAISAITPVSTHALMIFSESGITVYAEYNHILNVQLTIDASLFSDYSLSDLTQLLRGSELRLGIDIQLVSDALTAAASTTLPKPKTITTLDSVVCYIKYMGQGHPLIIEFDDRLMSELIEFSTFYYEYEYPYDSASHVTSELLINHDQVELEVILKSDLLANLLLDLHLLNTQDLYLYASTSGGDNQLNFISKGSIGYLKLTYPNAKTILEKMEVYSQKDIMEPTLGAVVSSFNFASFVRIFRAVRMSTRCKMMKDMTGVFSVQLLCKNLGISGYPGTLITFNMLERADEHEIDINTLFDDDLYQHVKEYPVDQTANTTEPFSYASFKVPRPDTRNENPRNKEGDDLVGGAVEVPLFL